MLIPPHPLPVYESGQVVVHEVSTLACLLAAMACMLAR